MPDPTPLTYKGRPVPYITAWSTEKTEPPRVRNVAGALALKGQKRAAGVLWRPWRNAPGVGEPRFADVHGPRQRECMMRLLCQVCRRPVVQNSLGWPWLLEDHRGEPGWPEREVTAHPPTCEPCQPVASVQCTPNRGRFVSLRVRQVLTDGVYGQLYTAASRPTPTGRKMVLLAGDSRLRWMLGLQSAATLVGVTVVNMHTQMPEPQEAGSR